MPNIIINIPLHFRVKLVSSIKIIKILEITDCIYTPLWCKITNVMDIEIMLETLDKN